MNVKQGDLTNRTAYKRGLNLFAVIISVIYYVESVKISFGYQFVALYTFFLLMFVVIAIGYIKRCDSLDKASKAYILLLFSCMFHLFSEIHLKLFDIKYCHLILLMITAVMLVVFKDQMMVLWKGRKYLVLCVFIEFLFFGYSLTLIFAQCRSIVFVFTVGMILLVWTALFMEGALYMLDYLVEVIQCKKAYEKNYFACHLEKINLSGKYIYVIKYFVLFGMVISICLPLSIIWYPGYFSDDNPWTYQLAVNIADAASRTDVSSFFYVVIFKIFSIFTQNYYPIT